MKNREKTLQKLKNSKTKKWAKSREYIVNPCP